jgi:hypothetical protein
MTDVQISVTAPAAVVVPAPQSRRLRRLRSAGSVLLRSYGRTVTAPYVVPDGSVARAARRA